MYRIAALILAFSVVAYSEDVGKLCRNQQGKAGSHFVRSATNCSVFYNCQGSLAFPFPLACGYGTVFSQSQQVCVYRNSYFDDCGKEVYSGRYNDPLCNQFPFGLNRDPTYCNRFIPCFNRTSYPSMACQKGLHFSVANQRCMTPSKADCRL